MSRMLLALSALLAVAALFTCSPCPAAEKHASVQARQGMVVCVSPPAAAVGVTILQQGGNAVDAAVAVAFAEAVTYPAAGNIGGGGFMLVYPGKGKEPVVIEYRETAPAAVRPDTLARDRDMLSARAVGVPGTVRGLELAHKRFGKLPWKEVVAPAVRLADEGFAITSPLAASLNWALGTSNNKEFRRVFGKEGNSEPWERGDRLVQKDLASTLGKIAASGADCFYRGEIASQIVGEMKLDNGFITSDDLAHYQANVRDPIHGTYRGYDIFGAPPPSSGGICLVEMLNILENYDLRKSERYSPRNVHLLAEASRRAFCDRARYLGDPAFTKIPAKLVSKDYARELAQGIDPDKATPSDTLAAEITLSVEGDSTTHFSVIDSEGMAVSNTYTLENSYGSGIVVRGAGFILNNEMGDFNTRPGVTTRTGRIGTAANVMAPGKRMLSSQSPTIVARDGKALLITGSPGSRTIINTILCVVVNVIDFDMDIQAAVDAPRMHHGWFPDVIRLERLNAYPDLEKGLKTMGHVLRTGKQGDAHSIWIDPRTGIYHGAADRRIDGKAAGW